MTSISGGSDFSNLKDKLVNYFSDNNNHADKDSKHISNEDLKKALKPESKLDLEAKVFLQSLVDNPNGYDVIKNITKESQFFLFNWNDKEISLEDLAQIDKVAAQLIPSDKRQKELLDKEIIKHSPAQQLSLRLAKDQMGSNFYDAYQEYKTRNFEFKKDANNNFKVIIKDKITNKQLSVIDVDDNNKLYLDQNPGLKLALSMYYGASGSLLSKSNLNKEDLRILVSEKLNQDNVAMTAMRKLTQDKMQEYASLMSKLTDNSDIGFAGADFAIDSDKKKIVVRYRYNEMSNGKALTSDGKPITKETMVVLTENDSNGVTPGNNLQLYQGFIFYMASNGVSEEKIIAALQDKRITYQEVTTLINESKSTTTISDSDIDYYYDYSQSHNPEMIPQEDFLNMAKSSPLAEFLRNDKNNRWSFTDETKTPFQVDANLMSFLLEYFEKSAQGSEQSAKNIREALFNGKDAIRNLNAEDIQKFIVFLWLPRDSEASKDFYTIAKNYMEQAGESKNSTMMNTNYVDRSFNINYLSNNGTLDADHIVVSECTKADLMEFLEAKEKAQQNSETGEVKDKDLVKMKETIGDMGDASAKSILSDYSANLAKKDPDAKSYLDMPKAIYAKYDYEMKSWMSLHGQNEDWMVGFNYYCAKKINAGGEVDRFITVEDLNKFYTEIHSMAIDPKSTNGNVVFKKGYEGYGQILDDITVLLDDVEKNGITESNKNSLESNHKSAVEYIRKYITMKALQAPDPALKRQEHWIPAIGSFVKGVVVEPFKIMAVMPGQYYQTASVNKLNDLKKYVLFPDRYLLTIALKTDSLKGDPTSLATHLESIQSEFNTTIFNTEIKQLREGKQVDVHEKMTTFCRERLKAFDAAGFSWLKSTDFDQYYQEGLKNRDKLKSYEDFFNPAKATVAGEFLDRMAQAMEKRDVFRSSSDFGANVLGEMASVVNHAADGFILDDAFDGKRLDYNRLPEYIREYAKESGGFEKVPAWKQEIGTNIFHIKPEDLDNTSALKVKQLLGQFVGEMDNGFSYGENPLAMDNFEREYNKKYWRGIAFDQKSNIGYSVKSVILKKYSDSLSGAPVSEDKLSISEKNSDEFDIQKINLNGLSKEELLQVDALMKKKYVQMGTEGIIQNMSRQGIHNLMVREEQNNGVAIVSYVNSSDPKHKDNETVKPSIVVTDLFLQDKLQLDSMHTSFEQQRTILDLKKQFLAGKIKKDQLADSLKKALVDRTLSFANYGGIGGNSDEDMDPWALGFLPTNIKDQKSFIEQAASGLESEKDIIVLDGNLSKNKNTLGGKIVKGVADTAQKVCGSDPEFQVKMSMLTNEFQSLDGSQISSMRISTDYDSIKVGNLDATEGNDSEFLGKTFNTVEDAIEGIFIVDQLKSAGKTISSDMKDLANVNTLIDRATAAIEAGKDPEEILSLVERGAKEFFIGREMMKDLIDLVIAKSWIDWFVSVGGAGGEGGVENKFVHDDGMLGTFYKQANVPGLLKPMLTSKMFQLFVMPYYTYPAKKFEEGDYWGAMFAMWGTNQIAAEHGMWGKTGNTLDKSYRGLRLPAQFTQEFMTNFRQNRSFISDFGAAYRSTLKGDGSRMATMMQEPFYAKKIANLSYKIDGFSKVHPKLAGGFKSFWLPVKQLGEQVSKNPQMRQNYVTRAVANTFRRADRGIEVVADGAAQFPEEMVKAGFRALRNPSRVISALHNRGAYVPFLNKLSMFQNASGQQNNNSKPAIYDNLLQMAFGGNDSIVASDLATNMRKMLFSQVADSNPELNNDKEKMKEVQNKIDEAIFGLKVNDSKELGAICKENKLDSKKLIAELESKGVLKDGYIAISDETTIFTHIDDYLKSIYNNADANKVMEAVKQATAPVNLSDPILLQDPEKMLGECEKAVRAKLGSVDLDGNGKMLQLDGALLTVKNHFMENTSVTSQIKDCAKGKIQSVVKNKFYNDILADVKNGLLAKEHANAEKQVLGFLGDPGAQRIVEDTIKESIDEIIKERSPEIDRIVNELINIEFMKVAGTLGYVDKSAIPDFNQHKTSFEIIFNDINAEQLEFKETITDQDIKDLRLPEEVTKQLLDNRLSEHLLKDPVKANAFKQGIATRIQERIGKYFGSNAGVIMTVPKGAFADESIEEIKKLGGIIDEVKTEARERTVNNVENNLKARLADKRGYRLDGELKKIIGNDAIKYCSDLDDVQKYELYKELQSTVDNLKNTTDMLVNDTNALFSYTLNQQLRGLENADINNIKQVSSDVVTKVNKQIDDIKNNKDIDDYTRQKLLEKMQKVADITNTLDAVKTVGDGASAKNLVIDAVTNLEGVKDYLSTFDNDISSKLSEMLKSPDKRTTFLRPKFLEKAQSLTKSNTDLRNTLSDVEKSIMSDTGRTTEVSMILDKANTMVDDVVEKKLLALETKPVDEIKIVAEEIITDLNKSIDEIKNNTVIDEYTKQKLLEKMEKITDITNTLDGLKTVPDTDVAKITEIITTARNGLSKLQAGTSSRKMLRGVISGRDTYQRSPMTTIDDKILAYSSVERGDLAKQITILNKKYGVKTEEIIKIINNNKDKIKSYGDFITIIENNLKTAYNSDSVQGPDPDPNSTPKAKSVYTDETKFRRMSQDLQDPGKLKQYYENNSEKLKQFWNSETMQKIREKVRKSNNQDGFVRIDLLTLGLSEVDIAAVSKEAVKTFGANGRDAAVIFGAIMLEKAIKGEDPDWESVIGTAADEQFLTGILFSYKQRAVGKLLGSEFTNQTAIGAITIMHTLLKDVAAAKSSSVSAMANSEMYNRANSQQNAAFSQILDQEIQSVKVDDKGNCSYKGIVLSSTEIEQRMKQLSSQATKDGNVSDNEMASMLKGKVISDWVMGELYKQYNVGAPSDKDKYTTLSGNVEELMGGYVQNQYVNSLINGNDLSQYIQFEDYALLCQPTMDADKAVTEFVENNFQADPAKDKIKEGLLANVNALRENLAKVYQQTSQLVSSYQNKESKVSSELVPAINKLLGFDAISAETLLDKAKSNNLRCKITPVKTDVEYHQPTKAQINEYTQNSLQQFQKISENTKGKSKVYIDKRITELNNLIALIDKSSDQDVVKVLEQNKQLLFGDNASLNKLYNNNISYDVQDVLFEIARNNVMKEFSGKQPPVYPVVVFKEEVDYFKKTHSLELEKAAQAKMGGDYSVGKQVFISSVSFGSMTSVSSLGNKLRKSEGSFAGVKHGLGWTSIVSIPVIAMASTRMGDAAYEWGYDVNGKKYKPVKAIGENVLAPFANSFAPVAYALPSTYFQDRLEKSLEGGTNKLLGNFVNTEKETTQDIVKIASKTVAMGIGVTADYVTWKKVIKPMIERDAVKLENGNKLSMNKLIKDAGAGIIDDAIDLGNGKIKVTISEKMKTELGLKENFIECDANDVKNAVKGKENSTLSKLLGNKKALLALTGVLALKNIISNIGEENFLEEATKATSGEMGTLVYYAAAEQAVTRMGVNGAVELGTIGKNAVKLSKATAIGAIVAELSVSLVENAPTLLGDEASVTKQRAAKDILGDAATAGTAVVLTDITLSALGLTAATGGAGAPVAAVVIVGGVVYVIASSASGYVYEHAGFREKDDEKEIKCVFQEKGGINLNITNQSRDSMGADVIKSRYPGVANLRTALKDNNIESILPDSIPAHPEYNGQKVLPYLRSLGITNITVDDLYDVSPDMLMAVADQVKAYKEQNGNPNDMNLEIKYSSIDSSLGFKQLVYDIKINGVAQSPLRLNVGKSKDDKGDDSTLSDVLVDRAIVVDGNPLPKLEVGSEEWRKWVFDIDKCGGWYSFGEYENIKMSSAGYELMTQLNKRGYMDINKLNLSAGAKKWLQESNRFETIVSALSNSKGGIDDLLNTWRDDSDVVSYVNEVITSATKNYIQDQNSKQNYTIEQFDDATMEDEFFKWKQSIDKNSTSVTLTGLDKLSNEEQVQYKNYLQELETIQTKWPKEVKQAIDDRRILNQQLGRANTNNIIWPLIEGDVTSYYNGNKFQEKYLEFKLRRLYESDFEPQKPGQSYLRAASDSSVDAINKINALYDKGFGVHSSEVIKIDGLKQPLQMTSKTELSSKVYTDFMTASDRSIFDQFCKDNNFKKKDDNKFEAPYVKDWKMENGKRVPVIAYAEMTFENTYSLYLRDLYETNVRKEWFGSTISLKKASTEERKAFLNYFVQNNKAFVKSTTEYSSTVRSSEAGAMTIQNGVNPGKFYIGVDTIVSLHDGAKHLQTLDDMSFLAMKYNIEELQLCVNFRKDQLNSVPDNVGINKQMQEYFENVISKGFNNVIIEGIKKSNNKEMMESINFLDKKIKISDDFSNWSVDEKDKFYKVLFYCASKQLSMIKEMNGTDEDKSEQLLYFSLYNK
ncbi:MAG: hypothetical protein DKM50_01595 [Candidatus Margulisiibacteriota bacterium]|nr:MAG: hypothetical protein DKM50_01595 [Candidatus Margulisiibacteriota bacterium]